jgi:hypothetical protein
MRTAAALGHIWFFDHTYGTLYVRASSCTIGPLAVHLACFFAAHFFCHADPKVRKKCGIFPRIKMGHSLGRNGPQFWEKWAAVTYVNPLTNGHKRTTEMAAKLSGHEFWPQTSTTKVQPTSQAAIIWISQSSCVASALRRVTIQIDWIGLMGRSQSSPNDFLV